VEATVVGTGGSVESVGAASVVERAARIFSDRQTESGDFVCVRCSYYSGIGGV